LSLSIHSDTLTLPLYHHLKYFSRKPFLSSI
jgi:hypothetical protein